MKNGDRPSKKTVIERTYRATPRELWELWTTKEGFESWWGPVGFRVKVHLIEARQGGKLQYDMIAATPELIAEMEETQGAASHKTTGWFAEYRPYERLLLKHMMDFLPGVEPYESVIEVDFVPQGEFVRMVTTLHALHSDEFSDMQVEGYTSQLSKLEERYAGK
jgi:uncharacterized protein YndB with AHSA1/START domain